MRRRCTFPNFSTSASSFWSSAHPCGFLNCSKFTESSRAGSACSESSFSLLQFHLLSSTTLWFILTCSLTIDTTLSTSGIDSTLNTIGLAMPSSPLTSLGWRWSWARSTARLDLRFSTSLRRCWRFVFSQWSRFATSWFRFSCCAWINQRRRRNGQSLSFLSTLHSTILRSTSSSAERFVGAILRTFRESFGRRNLEGRRQKTFTICVQ